MIQENFSQRIFYLILFLSVICFVAILKITSTVMIPVTLAILLSFVMHPIVNTLTRIHLPWIVAIILVSVMFVLIIVVGGIVLVTSITSILENYTLYEGRFLIIYQYIADMFNLAFDADKSFFDNLWIGLNNVFNFRGFVQHMAISLSGVIYIFSRNFLIVMLLVAFLLAEIKIMGDKINLAFEGKMKKRVIVIINKVIKEVVRFIFIKFFISLATGILVYFGLKIIGLNFAIIWAVAAFVLNFIPTFGSIASALGTTLFASLQFFSLTNPQDNGKIIAVFILMMVVNFTLGNIVEPKIEGDNLGISPFVILVGLSLWGWIWGFVGMILAVPFMVIIKIICENIPFLRPIAVLLSNKPKKETSYEDEDT